LLQRIASRQGDRSLGCGESDHCGGRGMAGGAWLTWRALCPRRARGARAKYPPDGRQISLPGGLRAPERSGRYGWGIGLLRLGGVMSAPRGRDVHHVERGGERPVREGIGPCAVSGPAAGHLPGHAGEAEPLAGAAQERRDVAGKCLYELAQGCVAGQYPSQCVLFWVACSGVNRESLLADLESPLLVDGEDGWLESFAAKGLDLVSTHRPSDISRATRGRG